MNPNLKGSTEMWGCWTLAPRPHPWVPEILDLHCGFEKKMSDPRCTGCHRRRHGWPGNQIEELARSRKERRLAAAGRAAAKLVAVKVKLER